MPFEARGLVIMPHRVDCWTSFLIEVRDSHIQVADNFQCCMWSKIRFKFCGPYMSTIGIEFQHFWCMTKLEAMMYDF